MSGAVLFWPGVLGESGPVTDTATLTLARSMVAQGAFPLIGAFLAPLCCYLLYQTVEHTRLLDLYEIVARIFRSRRLLWCSWSWTGERHLGDSLWTTRSTRPSKSSWPAFSSRTVDPLRDRIETVAGSGSTVPVAASS